MKRDETEKLMTELISYIQAVRCRQQPHNEDHDDAVYRAEVLVLEEKYKIWLRNRVKPTWNDGVEI